MSTTVRRTRPPPTEVPRSLIGASCHHSALREPDPSTKPSGHENVSMSLMKLWPRVHLPAPTPVERAMQDDQARQPRREFLERLGFVAVAASVPSVRVLDVARRHIAAPGWDMSWVERVSAARYKAVVDT